MTQYDQRQYKRMEEAMRAYQNGSIALDALISTLETLLDCLQQQEESWTTEFRKHWGVLEEVHAVALDRGKELETEDLRLVDECVQNIKRLLPNTTTLDDAEESS
jgi:hypothetical protein